MKYKKSISVVLAAGMVAMPLSSCSNATGGQMMAGGAAGGAAIGALLGNLIGGDTAGTLIGAGIGAAVGLIGGYVWNESMVRERAAYSSSQAYIQANQKQLDNRIAQAQKANRKTTNQVASIQQNKQKISAKDKQKETQVMTQNINLMEKDIQTAKKASKEASGAELQELRSKINTLSAEKKQMEKNRKAIASISTI